MQKKFLPVLVTATLLAVGAQAQDTAAQIAAPSTPAPAVQQAVPQQAQVAQVAPAPNQIIYAPRLPNPSELTAAAAAQGMAVEQINQSATQVTVVYRSASGQTNTVAYQLLPTATAPTTTVVVQNPAPTVVYETSPRVVYYDRYDPYYYPRYYYPPVSLSLGFGYYRGWGGGYHGGYHGGGHWGHHGR